MEAGPFIFHVNDSGSQGYIWNYETDLSSESGLERFFPT